MYFRTTVFALCSIVSVCVSQNGVIFQIVFNFSRENDNMVPTVERIEDIDTVELGEGPHWDADTQSLYFVDIFGTAIHKYVPATKQHTKAVIGEY